MVSNAKPIHVTRSAMAISEAAGAISELELLVSEKMPRN
jgi:hypothetical protein